MTSCTSLLTVALVLAGYCTFGEASAASYAKSTKPPAVGFKRNPSNGNGKKTLKLTSKTTATKAPEESIKSVKIVPLLPNTVITSIRPIGVEIDRFKNVIDAIGQAKIASTSTRVEMVPGADIVMALLYNTVYKQPMLVRQFRAPVFVHQVRQQSANIGKNPATIAWPNYPPSLGDTLELWSTPVHNGQDHISALIEALKNQSGYSVNRTNVNHIKTYLSNTDSSGSSTHLYYVEVGSDSASGTGLYSNSDYQRVPISEKMAYSMVYGSETTNAPATVLHALAWFLQRQQKTEPAKL